MPSINAPVKILDLEPVQLVDFIRLLGEPASQANQLLKGIYLECAAGFEEMTGLNPSLKQKLVDNASLGTLELIEERVSADAQTRKVLFRLEDNKTIESTLMCYQNSGSGRERRTVCVSSQVGCPIGCHFCATGQQGFERNLSSGEILSQILFFMRRYGDEAAEPGKKRSRGWLTNVVFMGMGEPLANYDNVRKAIVMLNSQKGMGLGLRQVTLSTSGLAPQIKQLAGEDLRFELAVSLHAANDTLRNRLVPINRKYPLDQLISACKEYASKTGRKIYIEYALFDGINDSINDADELVQLLDGLECSINLILGNPTNSTIFKPSPREIALVFQRKLINSGIRTMLRLSRGADIEAGCGQLRSRWLDN
ncbi:MAG: 23S rRNA (adenine(2503)-C(2))-methyltransferase RlmN [Dehalococcoidia bacterium]|nr:MAG: 23S rRNA (adenine(2503)-C(2))-methyltransferase RlmN [Dehalococcoidia bacterium]